MYPTDAGNAAYSTDAEYATDAASATDTAYATDAAYANDAAYATDTAYATLFFHSQSFSWNPPEFRLPSEESSLATILK